MPSLSDSFSPHYLLKRLRYLGEAAIAYPLYALVALLPLDAASWLGGFLAGILGPLMRFHSIADSNIRHVMPELTPSERRAILRKMWNNFGRVLAEYAHLDELWAKGRIEVVNREIADRIAAGKNRAIFAGGHLGNWEVGPVSAMGLGLPLAIAYRAPNNPMIDYILRIERRRGLATPLLMPKGPEGARGLLRHLLDGGTLGLLIDQKMSDGISVPFFGFETMTASAPAKLAIKTNCLFVPMRIERLRGAHFRITFEEPLPIPQETGAEGERVLMTRMNKILEGWIRADPGQWLWLHRRWGRLA